MKSLILLIIAISCISPQKIDFLRFKNFTDTSFPYQSYFNNTEENIILSEGDEVNDFDFFKLKGTVIPPKILKYILEKNLFLLSSNEIRNLLTIKYLGRIFTDGDYDSYLFSSLILNKNTFERRSLIRLNIKDENLCSMVYLYHVSLSGEFQYQEHTKIISNNKFKYISTVLYDDFAENEEAINKKSPINKYKLSKDGYVK